MMSNKRNIAILFFTLVVVMMGFGIMIPLLPFYIEMFDAGGSAMGILMAIYALMQFIFAPIWGRLSDQYGRKPILMIGILGNALSLFLFALSTELWMLYASRALAGVLSSATLPTAMAFMGDSTSDEDRGMGMGIMGAAMGVGMVIGPGLGGWLAGYSLGMPFFVAAALSLAAFFMVWAILPESLTEEEKQKAKEAGGSSSAKAQLGLMWQSLWGPLGFLLVLAFLVSFALTNFESVFGLYMVQVFEYSPQQVGTVLMVVGLLSAIVQGGITGMLTKRLGESLLIKAALLGTAVGFFLMLAAYDMTTVMLTVGFFVVSDSILRPAVSALTSKRADMGLGVAMGLNNSFMSLGRIAGPLWAGFMFDVNVKFPYITGGVVMFIGFLLCLKYLDKPVPETAVMPTSTD